VDWRRHRLRPVIVLARLRDRHGHVLAQAWVVYLVRDEHRARDRD